MTTTPEFLKVARERLKASQAVKSTRATETVKKLADQKAKKQESKGKSVDPKLEAAMTELKVTIPMIGYDSDLWTTLKNLEIEIPVAQCEVQKFGHAMRSAKGTQLNNWRPKKTLRENWARGHKDPQLLRDALFALVPEGPLKDMERAFLPKWGDYRTLGWKDWANEFFDMYGRDEFDADLDVWKLAVEFVQWELLTSRGTKDATPLIPKSDGIHDVTIGKNSGLPFVTKKWDRNPDMVRWYENIASKMLDGKQPWEVMVSDFGVTEDVAKAMTAAMLFTRRQANGGIDSLDDRDKCFSTTRPDGKPSVKMRAVECPIKSDAMAGKVFTGPMMERMREIPSYVGISGSDNIGIWMWEIVDNFPFCVEGDYSRFDSTCRRKMMTCVFEIIDNLFSNEFTKYFKMLCDWYPTMWVLTPSGIAVTTPEVEHGLLSGCIWTSILGSVVNRLANVYTLIRMGIDATNEEEVEILVAGDDTAIGSKQPIDSIVYSKTMEELGLVCHPDKQNSSSGPERYLTFLGYRHFAHISPSDYGDDYIGIFPILRTQLFYLESFTEDLSEILSATGLTAEQYDVVRYLSKLENLRNHPYRIHALATLVGWGLPVEHALSPDLEIPENLRYGRRSRGMRLSDGWVTNEWLVEF